MQKHHTQRFKPGYSALSAVLAFLLWGTWAYFVNQSKSGPNPLLYALTQGSASAVITLVMVRAVQALRTLWRHAFLQVFAPATIVVACTGVLLIGIHTWIGTPQIAATVSPPITVAFLFCIYTAYKQRPRRRDTHA